MRFDWYPIFRRSEFDALGLVSKELDLTLGDLGPKKIIITKGLTTSIIYEDLILPIKLNDKNPFRYGERAVFEDDNGVIWLGVYHAN